MWKRLPPVTSGPHCRSAIFSCACLGSPLCAVRCASQRGLQRLVALPSALTRTCTAPGLSYLVRGVAWYTVGGFPKPVLRAYCRQKNSGLSQGNLRPIVAARQGNRLTNICSITSSITATRLREGFGCRLAVAAIPPLAVQSVIATRRVAQVLRAYATHKCYTPTRLTLENIHHGQGPGPEIPEHD